MSHPRDRLRPGEKIILDTRPHWWYFARPAALVVGAVLIAILILIVVDPDTGTTTISNASVEENDILSQLELTNQGFGVDTDFSRIIQILSSVLILLSILILIITIISWYFTHFFFSTDRVVNRSGVLNRQGVEIPLERINTVFFEQNFVERIVGAGDVLIESAGESGVQRFFDIANPLAVKERLRQQIEIASTRRANQARGPEEKLLEADDSISAKIIELNELRRQGILSVTEFESKKTELLSRF